MIRYLAGRLMVVPPLLFGVSIVIFLILRLSPGDPAERILSQHGDYGAHPETVERLRAEWGLDLALPVQYGRWLGLLMRGDLGQSFATNRPVTELIMERLPLTLTLTGLALLLALLLAVPLGVIAAASAGRALDSICRVASLTGVSMPGFWLGMLLVWFFAVRLGWLPAIGRGGMEHLILPAIALAVHPAATQARLIRASLLEVLQEPHVRVARAKGLRERSVLIRHALRNALIPPVTSLGLSLGSLLGGAVVIETVFAFPGMGKLVIDAISARDYPVIQAFVLIMTVVFVGASLIVDAIYVLIDPRVRLGSRESP